MSEALTFVFYIPDKKRARQYTGMLFADLKIKEGGKRTYKLEGCAPPVGAFIEPVTYKSEVPLIYDIEFLEPRKDCLLRVSTTWPQRGGSKKLWQDFALFIIAKINDRDKVNLRLLSQADLERDLF